MFTGYTTARYSRDVSFIASRAITRPRGFINRPIRFTTRGIN